MSSAAWWTSASGPMVSGGYRMTPFTSSVTFSSRPTRSPYCSRCFGRANRSTTSFIPTTPRRRRFLSTTGTERSPRDRMIWTACSTVSSSATHCGFGVMKSRATTPSRARVSTRARTRSDRERMPTRAFPFTTGIARNPAEIIFSAASGNVASGGTWGPTCRTVEAFVDGGEFRRRIGRRGRRALRLPPPAVAQLADDPFLISAVGDLGQGPADRVMQGLMGEDVNEHRTPRDLRREVVHVPEMDGGRASILPRVEVGRTEGDGEAEELLSFGSRNHLEFPARDLGFSEVEDPVDPAVGERIQLVRIEDATHGVPRLRTERFRKVLSVGLDVPIP